MKKIAAVRNSVTAILLVASLSTTETVVTFGLASTIAVSSPSSAKAAGWGCRRASKSKTKFISVMKEWRRDKYGHNAKASQNRVYGAIYTNQAGNKKGCGWAWSTESAKVARTRANEFCKEYAEKYSPKAVDCKLAVEAAI